MSLEFHEFVTHPRYGQGPRITGLNPETGVPMIYRLNADSTVASKVDLAA